MSNIIHLISIDQLQENPNNPRIIKDERFKLLVKSIKEFPQMLSLRPLVITADNIVLGGNMRLRACIDAGMIQVPVIYADDLSPEQQKEFIIKDNVSFGEWDFELLRDDYWNLENLIDFGIELPSFEDVATDKGEIIDDEFELPEDVQTDIVAGDLFQLGSHKLLCGDAENAEDVQKLFKGAEPALMIIDPPYGIKRDKGFGGSRAFRGAKNSAPIIARSYTDEWDNERPSKEQFKFLLSLCKSSLIFGGNFFADQLPQGKHWIVWDKKNTMPTFSDCELIWTNLKRNSVVKIEVLYNGLIGKEKERFHPTQKPVKLYAELISKYSIASASITDLYVGSGTAIIAAEQLNRLCYGMDKSAKYVQITVDRFRKFRPDAVIKKNDELYKP